MPQPLEASCLANRSTRHPAASRKDRMSFRVSSTQRPVASRGGKFYPVHRRDAIAQKGGGPPNHDQGRRLSLPSIAAPQVARYLTRLVQRHSRTPEPREVSTRHLEISPARYVHATRSWRRAKKYQGPTLKNSALTNRRDAAAILGSQSNRSES
jgi:hypothetical protein